MKLPIQILQRWLSYALGVLIIVLCIYTIAGQRGAIHLWRLRAEQAKLDEQNYSLHRENERLRERISRLRTDNFYLEKVAREELNLVRPGEIVYRFASSGSRTGRMSGNESKLPPAKGK
jgi:cell division protein FtsB